jgi:hypothetical protein
MNLQIEKLASVRINEHPVLRRLRDVRDSHSNEGHLLATATP